MGEGWGAIFYPEFKKKYMIRLMNTIQKERAKKTVYPASNQVFRAFKTTPIDEVKVVVIGQDPYPHSAANGLAFSYEGNYRDIPPSLKNIFKELENDLGFNGVTHNPDLTRWAEQGVLLLNTTLTVPHGNSGGHQGLGWEKFTSRVISKIGSKDAKEKVFILWGNHAKNFMKSGYIDPLSHWSIQSSHPSPMSAYRSFLGSNPFSKTNELLKKIGYEPIKWHSS